MKNLSATINETIFDKRRGILEGITFPDELRDTIFDVKDVHEMIGNVNGDIAANTVIFAELEDAIQRIHGICDDSHPGWDCSSEGSFIKDLQKRIDQWKTEQNTYSYKSLPDDVENLLDVLVTLNQSPEFKQLQKDIREITADVLWRKKKVFVRISWSVNVVEHGDELSKLVFKTKYANKIQLLHTNGGSTISINGK